MRSRLGLLVLLSAVAACSAQDDASGTAAGDISATDPLAKVAVAKVGGIPLGAKSSFTVLDDDRAIWGAFGTTDDDCSETAFTRFSATTKEANLLPSGAWRRGRVSPNGRWVAAIGKADGTCSAAASTGELRVASTSGTSNLAFGTPGEFEFAGDLVVRFENDGATAKKATGEDAWTRALTGGPLGVPFHAVGPNNDVLLFASGAAKHIANDGTTTDVTGFPAFASRSDAAPRATFVAAGTIIVELPMATGFELWKITKDGASRLAQSVGMAVYTADKAHFAVVPSDGTVRAIDVYDVASLVRARISGLDTISTFALSAKGDRVAAAGTAAGKTVIASAATDADGSFTVLGQPGGVAQTIEVLPDGRLVLDAPSSASGDLGVFVAGTKAGSLKQLDTSGAATGFTVEPGATPTTVIAQKQLGKAVLLKLDGSDSTELPAYAANVAWTNGLDFYSFQNGATLGVLTAGGFDSHDKLIPNENPIVGTRFDSGVVSPSGRTLFVAAGAGVYRIDTAAPPGTASISAPGATHATPGAAATPSDGTSAPTTGTSGATDSSGSGSSSTSGSTDSTSTTGDTSIAKTPRTLSSSSGCSTTHGGTSGGGSSLALGLAAFAVLRRRRRAV